MIEYRPLDCQGSAIRHGSNAKVKETTDASNPDCYIYAPGETGGFEKNVEAAWCTFINESEEDGREEEVPYVDTQEISPDLPRDGDP